LRTVLTEGMIETFMNNPEYQMNILEEMAEYGITFTDAHAPWGTWKDLGMPLENHHEMVVLRHKMAIRVCAECGVKTLTFHTGNTLNSVFGQNLVLSDYERMLFRTLEELLPDAERYGVILALENQWTPLNQTMFLVKACTCFDSPHLGLCYDAGHANLVENGVFFPGSTIVPYIWDDLGIPVVWEHDIVDIMRPWIVNCHFHDNDGIEDKHWLVGAGTIDWRRIMSSLAAAPRLQVIQSEVIINPKEMTMSQLHEIFQGLANWVQA